MIELSTRELTEELCSKEGIWKIDVAPYENITIMTGGNEKNIIGPAIIVINQD